MPHPTDIDDLIRRIREAITVQAGQPYLNLPDSLRAAWPETPPSWQDYGSADAVLVPPQATPAQVTLSNEAMQWLVLLPVRDERRLLLSVGGGRSFRMLCRPQGERRRWRGPQWQFFPPKGAQSYSHDGIRKRHQAVIWKLYRTLKKRDRK